MDELTEEDYQRYADARLNTARQWREMAAKNLSAKLVKDEALTGLDLSQYVRAREAVGFWEIVAGNRGFGKGRTAKERAANVRTWLQVNTSRAQQTRRNVLPGYDFWRDGYRISEQEQLIRQLEDYAVRNFLACAAKREESGHG